LHFLPPPDKLPAEKKNVHRYHGLAQFVQGNFEQPEDTPPKEKVETREQRLERKHKEKEEQVAYELEQKIAVWDPTANPKATTDPFKTLFIGRVNFYSSESKMRREFEQYGTIKNIVVPTDVNSGKPRGYAFIEYESERDMHSAYKKADGMKIDGRRVLVDVERARTVKGWLPRRLGGGLGGTRRGGNDVNVRHSGREDGPRARSRSNERGGDRADRHRDRSRERDRDRRRKRSRSRSKDRSKRRRSRSRGDRKRSRSRDRKRRRSRSKDRRRGDRDRDRRVKDEPDERYDDGYGFQVKQENQQEDPDQKPNLDGNGGYHY